jgi:hypothetical protein
MLPGLVQISGGRSCSRDSDSGEECSLSYFVSSFGESRSLPLDTTPRPIGHAGRFGSRDTLAPLF